MDFLIKEVDETNWRAIAALSVSESQRGFIERNEQSLLSSL